MSVTKRLFTSRPFEASIFFCTLGWATIYGDAGIFSNLLQGLFVADRQQCETSYSGMLRAEFIHNFVCCFSPHGSQRFSYAATWDYKNIIMFRHGPPILLSSLFSL